MKRLITSSVVLALGCALLGGMLWRASRPGSRPVVADEATFVQDPATPLLSPNPITATVARRDVGVGDSAEQLLRELEPLAVTDKPAALAGALQADARLSADGVMAEARRALIVTLMVDTQRMSEARARARDFIRRYPGSRYTPLVKGVTGIHPRPSPSELRDARRPSGG